MDRLAHALYRLVSGLAGLLPLSVLCRLGMAGGWVAYHLLAPYRRLVLRNLAIAFPGEKTRSLARKHFMQLGGNLLGAVGIARLPADKLRGVLEVEGAENSQRLHDAGRGTIFVIAHLGNWEVFAQITPLLLKFPLGTIYQKLGNPHIDDEVRRARGQQGLALFERKEGFQGALKMLRAGGGVGVLADQHAGDAGLWCPFFGRYASTTSLPATLALRSGAGLLPSSVYMIEPGRWRVIFGPPLEVATRDVGTLTAHLNLEIERMVRRQPEDWFWVHNRWKTPRPKFLLATYKRGLVPPVDARPAQPFRMVIRSSNWLGDAVMSMPAVRAIKHGRPDAHVTILTPAKLRDLWAAVPEVDDIVAIEKDDSVWSVARKLRERFEVAIVFPNSFRTGLEPWLAGIPRRVGYAGHGRGFLLNQVWREKKKAHLRPPPHQVKQYLQLASFIGAETDEWRLAEQRAFAPSTPLRIAVCPGAEYGAAKRWPAERFAAAMQLVSAERACVWTIVGVAKDVPIAAEIVQQIAGLEVRDLTGKTSLHELMDELRQSALLLTNDTGTMHIAAMLGVPVVAVFGSTEHRLTGPLGTGHRVLRHHVECSPCFLRECPLDFRCMLAVEPAEVAQAVESCLADLQPQRG